MQWVRVSLVMLGQCVLAACGHVQTPADPEPEPTSSGPAGYQGGPKLSVIGFGQGAKGGAVCSSEAESVPLGESFRAAVVSPDGHWAALEMPEGIELYSLADGTRRLLAGTSDVRGARWSDDSQRLAYLAKQVPMLSSPDDDEAMPVSFEPIGSSLAELETSEWSRDGRQVAFVTHGTGLLVDAVTGTVRASWRHEVVTLTGANRALAFSPDGRYLAALEQAEALLLIDTETLVIRELPQVQALKLHGFTADSAWLVATTEQPARTWLVANESDEVQSLEELVYPSPTAPELAIIGFGSRLRSLVDGSERELRVGGIPFSELRWLADGRALNYRQTTGFGFVAASDSRLLASGRGVARADGWVALERENGIQVSDLYGVPDAGAFFERHGSVELDEPTLASTGNVSWLGDGRLAFVDADGVHFVEPDGSAESITCPGAQSLMPTQGGVLDRDW